MNVERLLEKLDRLWAEKRPGFARGLRKGASPARIARFETALGRRVPAAFRKLYAWHDGARDEHSDFEGFFGWLSLAGVQTHKKSFDQLETSGHFEEWGPQVWWNLGWVPFLQFNLEEHLCIDLPGSLGKGRGAVFVRRNVDYRRLVLAPSLQEWLRAHVEITAVGPDSAAEEEWLDHFESRRALSIRRKLTPGFPAIVHARR